MVHEDRNMLPEVVTELPYVSNKSCDKGTHFVFDS